MNKNGQADDFFSFVFFFCSVRRRRRRRRFCQFVRLHGTLLLSFLLLVCSCYLHFFISIDSSSLFLLLSIPLLYLCGAFVPGNSLPL